MPASRRGCCCCLGGGGRGHEEAGCIFCAIARGAGGPASRVVFQDERVVVLPDIRPAAALHLLVLPRAHVANVDALAASHAPLLRHMRAVGEAALLEQLALRERAGGAPRPAAQPAQRQRGAAGAQEPLLPGPPAGGAQQAPPPPQEEQQQQQRRPRLKFGFHRPPFRSVDHLHLHCFVLPLRWQAAWKYQDCLPNWVSHERLLQELAAQPAAAQRASAGAGGDDDAV
ncbi:HINT4 [Scenedesmus sp. PABB004]|nr:HINT4 [Scenedesmus sp. PABB004]